ncbi:CBS domain-containing protein [bacterium]|nr:CBS domain-containing protein [bacterium]
MHLVQDIMTKGCYCMRPEQTLAEILFEFDRRTISGGPVVDADGVVIGHLSRTGISRHFSKAGRIDQELKVSDVMETFAFQAYADDTVTSLLETMLASRIHRMIVTDDDGRAIGIVTSMDLMAMLYDRLKLEESNG